MTKSVLTLVTGISLALANIQSDVLRLDAAAATVTETDLAAIREATRGELLAVEAAKIPIPSPPTALIQAYLAPDTETPTVRRGRVVLVNGRPNDKGGTDWEMKDLKQWYAQVALPGEHLRDRLAPSDRDRPFIVSVSAGFTDAELTELATFVRQSRGDGVTTGVNGTWPIIALRRSGSTEVEVLMLDANGATRFATLRRQGGSWRHTSLGVVVF